MTDAAPWEETFVREMVRRRNALGLTQTDLAKAVRAQGLPFHQPTVQRIEAGERPVRLNEAFVISRELQTSLAAMTAEVAPDFEEVGQQIRMVQLHAGRKMDDVGAIVRDLLVASAPYRQSLFELFATEPRPDESSRVPVLALAALPDLVAALECLSGTYNALSTVVSSDDHRESLDDLPDLEDMRGLLRTHGYLLPSDERERRALVRRAQDGE